MSLEERLAGCDGWEAPLAEAARGAGPACALLPAAAFAALALTPGELVLVVAGESGGKAAVQCLCAQPQQAAAGRAAPLSLVLNEAAWEAAGRPSAGSVTRVYAFRMGQPVDAGVSASPRRLGARLVAATSLTLTLQPPPPPLCDGEPGEEEQSGAGDAAAALQRLQLADSPRAGSPGAGRGVRGTPPRGTPPKGAAASPASPAGLRPRKGAAAPPPGLLSADAAWLARAVGEASVSGQGEAAELLGILAARALDGAALPLGCCVSLPLLGRSARCIVAAAEGDAMPDADGPLPLYVVSLSTPTRLLLPSDPDAAPSAPVSLAPFAAHASRDEVQTAAASAAAAAAALISAQPPPRFSQLGGVDAAVAALRRLVVLPLTRPELFAAAGLRPPRGVLLYGPPGTGKTHLARCCAAEAGAALFVVSGPELLGEFAGESEARLRGVFDAARAHPGPAVVFLDEVDALAPARSGGGGGREGGGEAAGVHARMVTQLLTLLDGGSDDCEGSLSRLVLLAATNRPEALDRALRRPGRFDAEVAVAPPDAPGRAAILRTLLSAVRHSLPPPALDELALGLHGFTGADCCALVAEAAMGALRCAVAEAAAAGGPPGGPLPLSEALSVRACDFEAARLLVRPSALRFLRVDPPPPGGARWEDVGGLGGVKARLVEALAGATASTRRLGVTPPRGVLLYGPPGTGKTSLARCAAAAGGRSFICLAGTDVYSAWVGASEKAVAAAFAAARAAAPSLLFLDELDALAPRRDNGGGGSGAVARVVAQLLLELDGGAGDAARPDAPSILLLAATNRPDLVDSALLRPGRLDRLLHVPAPSSGEERLEVLQGLLRDTPLSAHAVAQLPALAGALEGFTGADCAALVRETQLDALAEELGPGGAPGPLEVRHFDAAQRRVHASPAVSEHMQRVYEKLARG